MKLLQEINGVFFWHHEVLLVCPFFSPELQHDICPDVKIIMTRYHALWLDPKGPFWLMCK